MPTWNRGAFSRRMARAVLAVAAYVFLAGTAPPALSGQSPPPVPSGPIIGPFSIPGMAAVPPRSTVYFVESPRPVPPGVSPPRLLMVFVTNASDHEAHVAYAGEVLTITAPAGLAIDILGDDRRSCAPVGEQSHVIRCTPVALGTNVSFTTAAPPALSATEVVLLAAGCTNVSLTWPSGTSLDTVAAAVAPTAALVAIWRLDAASGHFRGWSPMQGAPSDLIGVDRLDAVFLCLREPGTLARPAIEARRSDSASRSQDDVTSPGSA